MRNAARCALLIIAFVFCSLVYIEPSRAIDNLKNARGFLSLAGSDCLRRGDCKLLGWRVVLTENNREVCGRPAFRFARLDDITKRSVVRFFKCNVSYASVKNEKFCPVNNAVIGEQCGLSPKSIVRKSIKCVGRSDAAPFDREVSLTRIIFRNLDISDVSELGFICGYRIILYSNVSGSSWLSTSVLKTQTDMDTFSFFGDFYDLAAYGSNPGSFGQFESLISDIGSNNTDNYQRDSGERRPEVSASNIFGYSTLLVGMLLVITPHVSHLLLRP